MAKLATKYVCQECGTWHGKWSGKCDGCGVWNKLVEEVVETKPSKADHPSRSLELVSLESAISIPHRTKSGIEEFDRVCGGGIVPGSVILVGGDPGIGKSTLLLQVASKLSKENACAYISGEEGIDQIRLRAKRMGCEKSPVMLAASSSVSEILHSLSSQDKLKLVIIDSIQTMSVDSLESAPGTVSQVRASAHELIQFAKSRNISVVLVGHVTKDGTLAGPKVLEHMVDTVLHFEGEKHYPYRILRAVKNRFGPTDEIGIFNMNETGLEEVKNPSSLFLSEHDDAQIGMVIFAGLEGTRPLLAEIQALVAPSYLPSPRRTAVGLESTRLSMILAVLEARVGLSFGNKDVYVNVAGGLKVAETASDLAVAAALISSHFKKEMPRHAVYCGEIGLGGEIRRVQQLSIRLKEAEKLGFQSAYVAKEKKLPQSSVALTPLTHIRELVDMIRGHA